MSLSFVLFDSRAPLYPYLKKLHAFYAKDTFKRVTGTLLMTLIAVESLQRLEYSVNKNHYLKRKVKPSYLSTVLVKKKEYCVIALQTYLRFFAGLESRGESPRTSLIHSLGFLHAAQTVDALRSSFGGYSQFLKTYIPSPSDVYASDAFLCHQNFANALQDPLRKKATNFLLIKGKERETRRCLDLAIKKLQEESIGEFYLLNVPGLASSALADERGPGVFVSIGLGLEIRFRAEAINHPIYVYMGALDNWDQVNEDEDNFISTLLHILYSLRARNIGSHPFKLIAAVESDEAKKQLFDKFPQIKDFFEDERRTESQKSFVVDLHNEGLEDGQLKNKIGEKRWELINESVPEASPYLKWEIFLDVQEYAKSTSLSFEDALKRLYPVPSINLMDKFKSS